MWKKVISLFLILYLLTSLIGCGGTVTPEPVSEPIVPIIPETTIVIDGQTEQEITSITADQSTIVFKKSTPQLEELALGDIIVMGVTKNTPKGLLRKVTEITKGEKNDNEVMVETEFASLEEAIEHGSFEFDITLEPEDIEKNVSYPKGVRLLEDKFEGTYKFSYAIDEALCDNNLLVNGGLSFNYHIILNGTIGFFKLNTLEFKNTVESKAELDITLKGSFSPGDLLVNNPKTLFTIPFKTITVWIGVAPIIVPVTLTPQIDINVGLDGEIFTELTTGVTISQENEGAFVAGVEFNNGTWQEIKNEPEFSLDYREPSLSAGAKIKAYAGPQLELMLYLIVGPHCNIYGYLDFEADIWDDPWWELYGGLEVTAGVELEIITKFWSAVYSSPEFEIFDINKLIAQAEGPFGGINHAPVITSTPVTSATKDEPYNYDVNATDPDGDTLTYSLTVHPTGMNINSSTGVINWTPTSTGDYDVTVKVSDGELSDTQSFTITVLESNHAPIISSLTADPPSIDVNQTTSITCTASDEDVGDTLTYTWTKNGGTFEGSTAEPIITWRAPSTPGNYTVSCEVSDGEASDSEQAVITVNDPGSTNHPPEITSDPVTSATKDEPYNYDVNATDPDGDTLTYSLTVHPTGMNINSSTGVINWTPTSTGDYDVTVEVSDGELFSSQSFKITVGGEVGNVVEFEDPNLEQAVRDNINKPEGLLYLSDVIGIKHLNAFTRGIVSLEGIQYLQNLQNLNFWGNQVSDISALKNLTNLWYLYFGGNQVSDISALQNLTNLQQLSFPGNQEASDISALQNLTNLSYLDFRGNQVSDISVLENLTNLWYLDFSNNQVSDISALVNNEGFGPGDSIRMNHNYLDLTEGSQDMQDIETLINRGVEVDYEPQSNP